MTTKEKIYEILIQCAKEVKESENLDFIDIINDMPMKINEAVSTNLINGENLLVHNIILNLIRDNKKYKDYQILEDKEWIFKEFHDCYFAYDTIEADVLKCINSIIKEDLNERKGIYKSLQR